MSSAPGSFVSVRQFAKLDGCSHTLVAKAVKHGKLPVSGEGLIDPALAGTGWRRQNRAAAAVETPGGNTAKVATAVSISRKKVSESRKEVSTPPRRRGQAGAEPLDPLDLSDEDFIAMVLAGKFHSQAQAETVKENALAAKNLLAARRDAGDVVDLEVADTILFDLARSVRDAWLNWPSRVAPLIAAKLGISVEPLLEALNDHVQQHLADLGEPEADFAASAAGEG